MLFRLATLETLEGDYSGALKYDMRYLALFSQTSDSSSPARALNDVGPTIATSVNTRGSL